VQPDLAQCVQETIAISTSDMKTVAEHLISGAAGNVLAIPTSGNLATLLNAANALIEGAALGAVTIGFAYTVAACMFGYTP